MSSQLVFHFISGNSFFSGMLLVCLFSLLRLIWLQDAAQRGFRILTVIGASFILASGTPFPLWGYGLWFGVFIVTQLVLGKSEPLSRKLAQKLCVGVLALFSLGICAYEWPYRQFPQLEMPPEKTIYVVGDSVSSGLDEGEQPWPAVLERNTGLRIKNLARSGATVTTALSQAERIPEREALVLIEIGGNDLIGETGAADFASGLERLLETLHAQKHQLVMFELPLIPFYNRFGEAQRRLAEKYAVTLIPKRFLAGIFKIPGGTLDGIHLTQKGHNAFAERLEELVAFWED